MIKKLLLLSTICFIGFTSCKSKKRVVSSKKPRIENPSPQTTITEDKIETPNTVVKTPPKNASYVEIVATYIDNYSAIAKDEMLIYGIPASITLAQGILESGAGRGRLSTQANNHFGIKCHTGWTGERIYHDDDELQECFRKYRDAKYSFRDHSLFLSERSRYQNLFKLKKDDYKGWARGLRKAGYATDPKYPSKLISIIERYDLTKYDQEVHNGSSLDIIGETTANTYTVQKGDTLYSLSRRFKVTVASLKEYNGLKSNEISIGQLLYLHPDKRQ